MSSSACFCFGLALVCTVKLGESSFAAGVRQVLRAMVASSAIKVEKLCAGASSSRLPLLVLPKRRWNAWPVRPGLAWPWLAGRYRQTSTRACLAHAPFDVVGLPAAQQDMGTHPISQSVMDWAHLQVHPTLDSDL